jgi:large subunit ribosomal protein L6
MSNIGKKRILLPDNVTLKLNEETNHLTVTGKLGTLSKQITKDISISNITENGKSFLEVKTNNIKMWGTENRNLTNMIKGVNQGFKKKLNLVGVGYKCRIQDNVLYLKLGYSHEIEYKIPQDLNIIVTKPDQIVILGIDKEYLNQISYTIKSYQKPDSYIGKGIVFENETLLLKEGKKK